jgi:hypothetical protein
MYTLIIYIPVHNGTEMKFLTLLEEHTLMEPEKRLLDL